MKTTKILFDFKSKKSKEKMQIQAIKEHKTIQEIVYKILSEKYPKIFTNN